MYRMNERGPVSKETADSTSVPRQRVKFIQNHGRSEASVSGEIQEFLVPENEADTSLEWDTLCLV